MTDVVVEVGPDTVRGPNHVSPECLSTAIECIDDDLAVLDDCPLSVDDLWHEVMHSVAGAGVDTMVVVCPEWWPTSRIDRVHAAACAVAEVVAMRTRTSWLRDENPRAAIVEIAPEFVVVSAPDSSRTVVARRDDLGALMDAVAASLGTARSVVVDTPPGVNQADALGVAIADRLRANGFTVGFFDDVRHRATSPVTPHVTSGVSARTDQLRGAAATLAGLVSAAVCCGVLALRGGDPPADATTLLVEGRVGVMVPAGWTAQRVTTGPGSARVQVVSPSDGDLVLHITQSAGEAVGTLETTADTLRAALDQEPRGVFIDFNGADHTAGRPAVTYRELRAGHHVAWTVLVDHALRIAIGCQSAPGREHLIREPCDHAIGSAHAVR